MRKHVFFLMVALMGTFISAQAQNYNGGVDAATALTYTLTTTSATGTLTKSTTITGKKHLITNEVVVTKSSGTMTGVLYTEFSLDGANWYTKYTDTLSDASKNYAHTWYYNEAPYFRNRVYMNSSTQASTYKFLLYHQDYSR